MSPAMWGGVGRFKARLQSSKGSRKHVERWRTMWRMLFYKLGAAPKDFIRKEKFRIKLPRSLHKLQQLKELLR